MVATGNQSLGSSWRAIAGITYPEQPPAPTHVKVIHSFDEICAAAGKARASGAEAGGDDR